MRTLILTLLFLAAFSGGGAFAACDGGERYHVTRTGEDLHMIAKEYFGDPDKWTLILNANSRVLGSNPNHVPRGLRLRIPCLEAKDTTTQEEGPSDEGWTAKPRRKRIELRLLTGGAYEPFTDQELERGGLVTEIVENAFDMAPSPVSYAIEWNDNWSEHLDLLRQKKFDMGFPWLRPNCEENPENERCKYFHFSEPVFEMLVMLFVRKDAPVGFEEDADIEGIRLCRPEGYYTHDLDRSDRKWLENKVIELVQPPTPSDCFEMLASGKVDAASVNEFTGRTVMNELGLANCIEMEPRPLSIEGLHAIISKGHHRGTTHRYRFDAGVQKLREMAKYGEIVDRHMSNHWNAVSQLSGGEDNCKEYMAATKGTDDVDSPPQPAPENAEEYVEASKELVLAQRENVFFIYVEQRFLAPHMKDLERKGDNKIEKDYRPIAIAGNGTGFLITPDTIMTNSHVVSEANRVLVANKKFGVREVEVVDWTNMFDVGDPDYALLRLKEPLDTEGIPFSQLAGDLDVVFAMGHPGKAQSSDRAYVRFMQALKNGNEPSTFPIPITSEGSIQSRRRNAQGVEVLVHDSEISQGNSGGPLVDGCGRVVGINTLVAGGTGGGSTAQYETAMTASEILTYLEEQDVEVAVEASKCTS